jgi:hypothetical protein
MNAQYLEAVAKNVKREQARTAFESTDREAFAKLSDKELAEIQSRFEPYDPQYILASHEWNVRLVSRQLNATRFSTWAGIGGTILGVLLGYLLK